MVVKHERADLEEQRESLIQQMSENKVLLSKLEESLLSNLSNARGNILDNQVPMPSCFSARRASLSPVHSVLSWGISCAYEAVLCWGHAAVVVRYKHCDMAGVN